MHLFTVCLAALVACSLAAPTSTPVPILKQINKVDDDGSITFGFESADGTFRVEKRTKDGQVSGKYGYVDETGQVKVVEYKAGENTGFQPTGSHLPVDVPLPVVPVAAPQNNPASTFQNGQLFAASLPQPPKAVLAVQNTPADTSSVQVPVLVASTDSESSDDQSNDAEWQSVDADEDGIPDTVPVSRPVPVAVHVPSVLPASTTFLKADQVQVPVPVAQPPQAFQFPTATHPQAIQFLLDQNAQLATFQLGPNGQFVPFTFFPQQLNVQ